MDVVEAYAWLSTAIPRLERAAGPPEEGPELLVLLTQLGRRNLLNLATEAMEQCKAMLTPDQKAAAEKRAATISAERP